jgi:hypothetical protein
MHFMESVHQMTLTRRRLLHLLTWLDGTHGDYLTIYVRPSSFPRCATDLEPEFPPFASEIRTALSTDAVLGEAQRYGTGAVVFWSESENKLIALPSFAPPEDRAFQGRPETSLLHQLLEQQRILGVVLVT